MQLVAIGRTDVKPLKISPRLRSQFVYFACPPGQQGIPKLEEGEFFFALKETEKWQDDGVIFLVSPLDTDNMTEVELTEEQEDLMDWLVNHKLEHVRLEGE